MATRVYTTASFCWARFSTVVDPDWNRGRLSGRRLSRFHFGAGLIPSKAIEKIKAELPDVPVVREFLDFCATSQRGVVATPPAGHRD